MRGMKQVRIISLLGSAIAALSTLAAAVPAEANGRIDPFALIVLSEHNQERVRTGAEPLRWSADLTNEAQEWADWLAETEKFEHASYTVRRKAGENLWIGSAGYFSAQQMIGGFLAEKPDFRPGTFPHVSRTGQWSDVGHYTQIIWRDTREIGCAVARSRINEILVCRYFPSGNVMGEKID